MFKGSIAAIITPFYQGQIDYSSLYRLVEWHIEQKTDGLVVCGSTGEGLLMNNNDWQDTLKAAVKASNGAIPIIAGCGHASTEITRHQIHAAKDLGADACLVVAPFYVRPTQEAIVTHYTALHDCVKIPLILYNNPARCQVDMSLDTIITLSKLKRVVGLKESNPDITRLTYLSAHVKPDFSLLAGEDTLFPYYLMGGGHGAILVVANIVPDLCRKLVNSYHNNDQKTFKETQRLLYTVSDTLQGGPNPVPIKAAVSLMKRCHNELKLPLLPLTPQQLETLKQKMKNLNLI